VKEEERMVRVVCVCFGHGCVLGERTSDKRKACDVSIFVWNAKSIDIELGPTFSKVILPGASLALLLANLPGVLAPGIVP
jgi:hypothetical protein